MKILIINNSKESDLEITKIITDFFEHLQTFCEQIPPYEMILASENLKNEIREMNRGSQRLITTFTEYFFNNACTGLKGELANYFNEEDLNQSKTIILDEDAIANYPWGEATDCFAIIKKITKYNIWHEFSHLLGMNDHYDIDFKPVFSCDSEDCIMRYGIASYEFCKQGRLELKKILEEIVNVV